MKVVDLLRLQREQYLHDRRNHPDIHCMSKTDRLKHYGLHFAKYVGRLARGATEEKPVDQTMADAFLVALSAANTLHQDPRKEPPLVHQRGAQIDPLYFFADAAGRFADACEKIDHAEEYLPIARTANRDILGWLLAHSTERRLDLESAIQSRRKQLAERQFLLTD